MAAAFLVIPLMDGHVAVRAFAVLLQHLVAQRVALLAAGNEVASVDETGPLVAEAAPGRLAASVNSRIRAIALEMPFVAAAAALQVFYRRHLFPAFKIRALLQLPLKPTFSFLKSRTGACTRRAVRHGVVYASASAYSIAKHVLGGCS
jgi:hypothetical protein